MPLETKKAIWTVTSVIIILLVVIGVAMVIVYPKKNSGAPASVAAVAPPRSTSPDEYLYMPTPVPAQSPVQANSSAEITIYYGDKPDSSVISPEQSTAVPSTTQVSSEQAKPDSSATALPPAQAPVSSVPKPYTPSSSTSATSTPQKVVPQSKPSSQVKPSVSATSAQKVVPTAKPVGSYWIQAAAFTSRNRADDLQRQLSVSGLTSAIHIKELDNLTWYRVRVGPYNSEKEAKNWLEKIRKFTGCSEAYISQQTKK